MAKLSLKMFFNQDSIKDRVENWQEQDCLDYLNHHCNGKKKSSLLKKKLEEVILRARKSLAKNEKLIRKILADPTTKDLILKDEIILKSVVKNENAKNQFQMTLKH